jgi:hypothetical protein
MSGREMAEEQRTKKKRKNAELETKNQSNKKQ